MGINVNNAISQELFFFLKSILTGCFIIFIYDLIRIFRRVVKHGIISIALEDFIYWISMAAIIFVMMYKENDGAIRGFAMAGIFLGMLVYSSSLSKFVVKYSAAIINTFLKVIKKILHVIFTPIRFVIKKTSAKKQKVKKNLSKRLKKSLKEVRITLRKH